MTAIGFVHPNQFPSLISDCMVTIEGGGEQLTPEAIGFANPSKIVRNAILARKYVVIEEEKAIFGFSGPLDAIQDFRVFLPIRLNNRPPGVRTMRFVGDIANDFNSDRGSLDLSVVGFSAIEQDGQKGVNILGGLHGESVMTKNLNQVFATGSGATDLLKSISECDADILGWPQKVSPRDHLIGLVGALNSKKIFDRRLTAAKDTWGGYLEFATLVGYEKFQYPPSWTHLAYLVETNPLAISQLGKQIHYSPKGEGSALLVRLKDRAGNNDAISWPIREYLNAAIAPWSRVEDWRDFQPGGVTICIVLDYGKRIFHRTLSGMEMSGVENKGHGDISLSEEVLMKIINETLTSNSEKR